MKFVGSRGEAFLVVLEAPSSCRFTNFKLEVELEYEICGVQEQSPVGGSRGQSPLKL